LLLKKSFLVVLYIDIYILYQIVIYFICLAVNGFILKIMTRKKVTKKQILILCRRRSYWWRIYIGKRLRCSGLHIIILGSVVSTYCGGRSFGWRTLFKFNSIMKRSDLLLLLPFLFFMCFILCNVSTMIETPKHICIDLSILPFFWSLRINIVLNFIISKTNSIKWLPLNIKNFF